MSFISRTFGYFSCSTRIFFILKTFLMFIVLGKQGWFIACYKLHCIMINFWPKFINVKIISTCHVIDMWTCVVSLSFMCICWQRNRSNAKGENGKCFCISMWKQPWWSHFNIMHGTQFPFSFLFCFIDHKVYKYYVRIICTKGKKDHVWICF